MHLIDGFPDSIIALIMTFLVGIPVALLGLKWDKEGKNKLINDHENDKS